jgi:hypothetical protein
LATLTNVRRPVALVVATIAVTALAACTSGKSSSSRSAASETGRSSATGTATTSPSRPATGPGTTSPAVATPSASTSAGTVTISFAGDVNFSGRTAARLADPATAFGVAAPGLRAADITMVNLETAITTGGDPQAKEFHFRTPPIALTALRDAGIDVATMANNHGADYGSSGLADTLAAITASHFPVIGIGRDAAQAFAPYERTVNGVQIAIIAADQVQDETTLRLFSAGASTPGVANAFSPRLLEAVRTAKAAGYTVIVYVHWGTEYQTCPNDNQRSLADQLAKAGATAVIGTHAHVLQGAGWRPDGTYVAYGLGNYFWWMSFGNNQDDNGVLTLTVKPGRVVASSFAASHLDENGIPVPATGEQKSRIDAEWNSDRGCADLAATPPR